MEGIFNVKLTMNNDNVITGISTEKIDDLDAQLFTVILRSVINMTNSVKREVAKFYNTQSSTEDATLTPELSGEETANIGNDTEKADNIAEL